MQAHLYIEYHLAKYQDQINSENEENKAYFTNEALKAHSFAVHDPFRDISIESSKFLLKNPEANQFMLYGFSRRAGMIFYAYNSLIFNASPNRKEPLSFQEGIKLDSDLNSIYINIRGALDNLAACYLWEKEPEIIKDLKPSETHLFNKRIKQNSINLEFMEKIFKYATWEKDLKERRDPVAHRMPLYMVRNVIENSELDEYVKNIQTHNHQKSVGMFDDAQLTMTKLRKMGTFSPLFAHSPKFPPYFVYPTVPNDVVKLMEIYEIIRDAILY